MKKVYPFIVCGLFFVLGFTASCGESNKEKSQREMIDSLENANFQLRMNHEDLQRYLTIIADGLDSIAIEEKELLVNNTIEGKSLNRQRMKQNLNHVRGILARHRARIDTLEAQMRDGNANVMKLRTIISALRQQLDSKDRELAQLKIVLEGNKKDITSLKEQIAQMSDDQLEQEKLIQEQEKTIAEQKRGMNLCYVKIGTKKELKDLGLLSSRFLKKAKVDYSQIDKTLFQELDLNVTQSIALPKKYKIMTSVPQDSYEISSDGAGGHILTISDPNKFWSVSKFLIIQID